MATYNFTVAGGTPIVATAASAVNDGTTPTANGATMTVGSDTPTQAHLRFDTAAVLPDLATHEVVGLKLILTLSASVTPTRPIEVWAEQFGAAIAAADYNNGVANNTPGSRRFKIATIAPAGSYASGATLELQLPTTMLHDSINLFTDLTVRLADEDGAASGDVLTFHGPAASNAVQKPKLVGVAVAQADLHLYREPGFGDEEWIGFDLETTEGVPVKATILLNCLGHDLSGVPSNIPSGASSRSRSRPRSAAPGRASAGGSMRFEITPERWVKMLMGLFYISNTSGPTTIDGVATYVHTLKVRPRRTIPSMTLTSYLGDYRRMIRGAKLGSLALSSRINSALEGMASFLGLEEYYYDVDSAGADDSYILGSTAGYDSLDNSFATDIRASLYSGAGRIDGAKVSAFDISMAQGLTETFGHNNKRYATAIRAGGFSADGSFTMELEDLALLLNMQGIDRTTFPARAEQKVLFDSVVFEIVGPLGADNQKLKFTLPEANVMVARPNITPGQPITLNCQLMGFDDAASGGSIVLELTCSHPASFFNNSTDLVTVLPPEQVLL